MPDAAAAPIRTAPFEARRARRNRRSRDTNRDGCGRGKSLSLIGRVRWWQAVQRVRSWLLGVYLMDRDGKAGLAGQLRFYCFDNVVRHERFAVVLADVTVRGETGFAPEITSELPAVIVFNQDHVLTAYENGADLRRVQRHNPFNGDLIGHDAFFARQFFHRFADYARGRAPTHQRDIGILRTNEFRRRDVFDRALHFAGAFLHHHPPFLRIGEFITDERAVFVVFVGRGGKNVTEHSRHRARRNSARRVLVTQIRLVVVAAGGIRAVSVAVRQNQFTPVDLHLEVQIIGIDARGSFGNQQIGQDQTGTLVFVAEVEQLWNRVK